MSIEFIIIPQHILLYLHIFFVNDITCLTPDNIDFILLGALNAKHSACNCTLNNAAGNALNNLQQSRNFSVFYPRKPMTVTAMDYIIPSDHRSILSSMSCA